MMMELAPVVLFAYKRLELLKRTVEHLQRNRYADESVLYVFSDAAKDESETAIINQVRTFIRSITGFHQLVVIEAVVHKGLATSVIEGVSEVLLHHDRVIVLEDDLLTSPNFLCFMNDCLEKYARQSNVFSVSGYSFNLGQKPGVGQQCDVYFLPRGWSWGWATWYDRWKHVDWNVSDYNLFKRNKTERKRFAALGGSDLNGMLDKQVQGKLDSWAIRWFYHQFRINGLTLYPVKSKIDNMGWDINATHTKGSCKRYIPFLDSEIKQKHLLPDSIEVEIWYHNRFKRKMGWMARLKSKLESIIIRITK